MFDDFQPSAGGSSWNKTLFTPVLRGIPRAVK